MALDYKIQTETDPDGTIITKTYDKNGTVISIKKTMRPRQRIMSVDGTTIWI